MAKKKIAGVSAPVAVGLAATAAAAAAAAYWLYGAKDAQMHRRQAKAWMLRARAEVLEQVSKLKDIDKQQFLDIADKVAKGYASAAGGAQSPEMKRFIRDLQDTWRHIQGERGTQKAKTTTAGTKNSGTKKRARR